MRWALDQSIDNPWVRDESLARMLGASGVVRAHQFVTLLRKQRVELVETLPLALFLFLVPPPLMGVALYDDGSHLNIFYQETGNCNGRIVVEKMVL
jgi:hypothetical protein